MIFYKNIPYPVLLKEESNTFLILFKDEQKWIFECSLGYGEIKKDEYGICYLFNGKCHREDGPAVEYTDGTKKWYQNGKFHRLYGPALEYSDGHKEWCLNGYRHREDGPAVEYANGFKEWYIENIEYSEKGYLKKIEEMKRDETSSL